MRCLLFFQMDSWMCDKLNEIYDMRATPSVYLIGSDGKILLKNTTLNMAVNKAFEQLK